MPVEWHGQRAYEALRNGAFNAAHAGGLVLQTEMKKVLGEGGASNRSNPNGRSSPAGKPPAVNTGHLRRSIALGEVVFDGKTARVKVGTNVKYARIHEFGGVVVAKGKGLTIPVHPDAKRASARGQSAREAFPDAFIVKGRKQLLLVRHKGKATGKGKGWAMEVLYVIKKTVRMPPRPFMRPALARAGTKIAAVMRREFELTMKRI